MVNFHVKRLTLHFYDRQLSFRSPALTPRGTVQSSPRVADCTLFWRPPTWRADIRVSVIHMKCCIFSSIPIDVQYWLLQPSHVVFSTGSHVACCTLLYNPPIWYAVLFFCKHLTWRAVLSSTIIPRGARYSVLPFGILSLEERNTAQFSHPAWRVLSCTIIPRGVNFYCRTYQSPLISSNTCSISNTKINHFKTQLVSPLCFPSFSPNRILAS
jgi:hypothetical protein